MILILKAFSKCFNIKLNSQFFISIRWYLGSALRSGKLKIQVLDNTIESKTTPQTNGVAGPIEKAPEDAKMVNK